MTESVEWQQTACSSRGRGTKSVLRLIFIVFNYVYVFLSTCRYVHMNAGALKLELQTVVSHLTRRLGMELRSYWRAASAISPAPRSLLLTWKLNVNPAKPKLGGGFNLCTFLLLTSPITELRESCLEGVKKKGMALGDFGISFWRVFQDNSAQTRWSLPGRVS